MTRALVAYASRHGSTEEVARAVATQLREAGLHVDLLPAASVEAVAEYDVVVLGGALYMGRWHADARRFLRRHHAAVDHVPLAVFALGPRDLSLPQVEESRRQLDAALARLEIAPAHIAIFGGVVNPAKLPFPLSRMTASDARDWQAIRSWAEEIPGLARAGAPDLLSHGG